MDVDQVIIQSRRCRPEAALATPPAADNRRLPSHASTMTISQRPSAVSPPLTERISHLQHLRAIAALMVLLQHSQFLHHPDWIGSVFGGLGIDLFFVISGFVIFWVTRNETSFRRYLLRRIIRIVPLYWMLTLLMAALVLLAPQLFKQTIFDLWHFIKSLAFIPSFTPSRPDEITPLLPPGWTLNYEFFFYLSFGLIFFLPGNRTFRLAIFTVLFFGLVIAGKILAPAGAMGRVYTSPLLLEFLAGVWIGVWINGSSAVPGKGVALALLLAGWLALLFEPLLFGWGALVGTSMVVLGAVALERELRVQSRLLEFLGDASYSIYLTHVFTIGALKQVWVRLPFRSDMPFEAAAFMVLAIVLSTCAGALVYLYVERPVLRFLNRVLQPGRNGTGTVT
ncbi:MAG: acyltransferase family protein [Burkholderiales bacterium]